MISDWLEQHGDARNRTAVDPWVERHRHTTDVEVRGGYVVTARAWGLLGTPAVVSLLSSASGSFVEDAKIYGTHGVADLPEHAAPALRSLTVQLEQSSALPLPFAALQNLEVRGPGVENLEVCSPTLQALKLVSPFRRATRPRPLSRLDTPALEDLIVEFSAAPDAATATELIRQIESLEVKRLCLLPASLDCVLALLRHGMIERLQALTLRSCWPDAVHAVLEHSEPFTHLRLRLMVLAAPEERFALERSLTTALPLAELTGASHRGEGGYAQERPVFAT